jgi:iron-sulfur cluster assembly accessory protein
MNITMTAAAADHIKKMAEQTQDAKGFRLSLKKTGCSGMAYVPGIISTVNEADFHFVQHDLNIYIDRAYENFLQDLVIDYVEDTNVGLKQKRLVFINPNEKNRCGCGESFTT